MYTPAPIYQPLTQPVKPNTIPEHPVVPFPLGSHPPPQNSLFLPYKKQLMREKKWDMGMAKLLPSLAATGWKEMERKNEKGGGGDREYRWESLRVKSQRKQSLKG